MIPEIQDYLKQANPDFTSGFALFCRYSRNRNLISYLGWKQDTDMLMYELRKLDPVAIADGPAAAIPEIVRLQATVPDPGPAPAPEPAPGERPRVVFRTYDERRTRRDDLPDDLKEVYDRTIQEYPVRRGYHEKMKAARTDHDRAIFRAKILETQDRINAGWKPINAFLLASETSKQDTAFNEKSCRSYISKALKAPRTSAKKAAGVKARVQALLDHGCNISEATMQALQDKGLI